MGVNFNKNGTQGSNTPPRRKINPVLFALLVLFLGSGIYQFAKGKLDTPDSVSPSTLLDEIRNGEASEIKVEMGTLLATVTWKSSEGPDAPQEEVIEKATELPFFLVGEYFTNEIVEKLGDDFDYKAQPPSFGEMFSGLFSILLLVASIALMVFFFKNMQNGGPGKAMSFGKSRAKKVEGDENKVKFADVAGQEEAKIELQEVVDFLKNPEEYHKIGAKIPRGVLLTGMPGTGKTLLARAVAGEAEVSFFHMSGSDFVEMFVGVGASRVRDLFEQGRKASPCIIFIDELDAVGRTRGAGYGGGHDEREQTLNQMLVEMDGFFPTDNVIVLAATNRPDVLDPALLRPGRFDRQVVVDMPDVQERAAILEVHVKKIKLATDVDLLRIAKATPGSSGADLANLVNEAALFAARRKRKKVSMIDFEEARDKMIMGVARRSRVIEDDEKLATAYHEAGHALLHYHLKNVDPLHKVTIIPRGRAAGVTFSLPERDVHFQNRSELMDRIKLCMGGFIAEKLIYGETTTGTQNDIKQATAIARKMVREWGMSTLGFLSFGQEDEPIFIGKELTQAREYSEETSRSIDAEVFKIINICMDDASSILERELSALKVLATALIEKETLDDEDIRTLLGMEPAPNKNTLTNKKGGVPKAQKPVKENDPEVEDSISEVVDVIEISDTSDPQEKK